MPIARRIPRPRVWSTEDSQAEKSAPSAPITAVAAATTPILEGVDEEGTPFWVDLHTGGSSWLQPPPESSIVKSPALLVGDGPPGFMAAPSGRTFVVTHVEEGGAAEAGGLLEGDTLLHAAAGAAADVAVDLVAARGSVVALFAAFAAAQRPLSLIIARRIPRPRVWSTEDSQTEKSAPSAPVTAVAAATATEVVRARRGYTQRLFSAVQASSARPESRNRSRKK